MSSTIAKIALVFVCSLTVFSQSEKDIVSTREMERINWMEFKEAIPSRISTVILPTGTLEPHGVINNGA
ncbi:MAG: creatininase family protein, partial [Pyrinomonadaceae bacterium]